MFSVLSIVVVTAIPNPIIIVALLPIALLLLCTRNYYIPTSRELKRLEGASLWQVVKSASDLSKSDIPTCFNNSDITYSARNHPTNLTFLPTPPLQYEFIIKDISLKTSNRNMLRDSIFLIESHTNYSLLVSSALNTHCQMVTYESLSL